MDAAQLATFKAAIESESDPIVVDALDLSNGRNDTVIAEFYNVMTTQDVWRTSVPPEEYMKSIVWSEMGNIGTGTVGSIERIVTSQGVERIWKMVTGWQSLPLQASDPNVRQGIKDAFDVPSSAQTYAALVALAKRKASRFEMLFATGGGATMDLVLEGPVITQHVSSALNTA